MKVFSSCTLCLLSVASGCNDSQQAGMASGKKTPDTASAVPTYTYTSAGTDTSVQSATGTNNTTGINVNLSPSCDPAQDFYTPDYPQNVKDCLAQGYLFNFATNQCTTMFRASFNCTYAQLAQEMANLGLDASALQVEAGRGLKLITCGTSNDGFTLVAQFYRPSVASSSATATNIGVGTGTPTGCPFAGASAVSAQCYRKFVTPSSPSPAPADQSGTSAYLNNCLQANPG